MHSDVIADPDAARQQEMRQLVRLAVQLAVRPAALAPDDQRLLLGDRVDDAFEQVREVELHGKSLLCQMCADAEELAGSGAEGLFDLLSGDEITVQRIIGVHSDSAVQMLSGVQDA